MPEIKSSADILRANVASASKMNDQSAALKIAQVKVTNPDEYTLREELHAAGLARLFDEMQATLLNVKSQDTTASITGTRLTNEQKALEQVNKIMNTHEGEVSQTNSAAGTKQDKVNKALAALEVAMRSKDTSGEYVWGGKDSGTDPLSRLDPNGNRVAVDLKKDSNLVNGLMTNNFSATASNNTVVTVSSAHEVNESLIHPGHSAVAKAIGYLNMIKANADAVDAGGPAIYTDEQLASAQTTQKNARGELKMLMSLEIKKVKEAFKVNKEDAKDAMQLNNDIFTANIVERTQHVKDLLVSLTALISLANIDGKVSDALSNLRV